MDEKKITCARCGQHRPQMGFKPFQNELGQQLFDTICTVCWAEWLKTQQQLINHYALVPHQPKAKEFLLRNLDQFLFGTGAADAVS